MDESWLIGLMMGVLGIVLIVGLSMALRIGERALLHQERQADTRARVEIAQAQPANVPAHYAPHIQLTQAPERAALAGPAAILDVPPLTLPGVTTLGQVAGYRPTRDRILLGLGPGGTLITVSIEELLHLLIVGRTGGGKSVIERLIMTCLGAIPDVELHWWNPHYTPRDPDTGDEWDLIAARCVGGRALVEEGEILAALERMALQELPARKARYHAGTHPGPPRFYVIDEAPILAAADKRFMPWLGAVLREGRKFGLMVILATQDALISTLGGSSGLRSQAQTIYYVGGDTYSARALLGFVPPDPARGEPYIRSAATANVIQARVPMPTNEDIRALLGPLLATQSATNGYGPDHDLATDGVINLHARKSGYRHETVANVATVAISEEAKRALALFNAGKDVSEIVEVLSEGRVTSKMGGTYQKEATRVQALIREATTAFLP